MKYKEIFEKIYINNLQVENRIILPAMDLGMSKKGYISDELIRFYELRAQNEVGLVIIGGAYIGQKTRTWDGILGIDKDEFVPGLKKFNKNIHQYSTKTAIQLMHPGRYAHPAFTGQNPVSASDIPSGLFPNLVPTPMSKSDINHTVNLYASAVERARQSGFDAVEIIGSMGYLISQFLSPITNKREDEYGGSLENRIRFPLQIIRAIKERVGKDYPIIFRISGDDIMEGSNKIDDYILIAPELENAGVDAFHVTPGWQESKINNIIMTVPRAAFYYLSKKIKETVNIPVITASRFTDPEDICEVLINDYADCVSIGRPLICDPQFVSKIKRDKEKEIRKCIACNQGCFDSIIGFKTITCLQNPDVLGQKKLKKTRNPLDIVILGAGPAGLEAARVLKERGHEVKIFEKNGFIGGASLTSSLSPGRREFSTIAKFYENEIERLNIEVVYNWDSDINRLIDEKPGIVIVATGGKPYIPPIKGMEYAVPADRVLENREPLGKKVVIIGGGGVGCETALYAAKKGAMNPEQFYFNLSAGILPLKDALEAAKKNNREVIILEKLMAVARSFGRSTRWVILRELEECGINWYTRVNINEVIKKGEGFIIETELKQKEPETKKFYLEKRQFAADTVINACGTVPNDDLYNQLKDKVNKIYKIGDAKEVRNCLAAVHEGFQLGHTL